jgi:hypothetical protein
MPATTFNPFADLKVMLVTRKLALVAVILECGPHHDRT